MSIDEKAFLLTMDHRGIPLLYIHARQSYREVIEAYEAAKAEHPTCKESLQVADQPDEESDEEKEAMTVIQLINKLEELPNDYTVHINTGKAVLGIIGAKDIGGDYFSQVFLDHFDHDADDIKPKRESAQPVELKGSQWLELHEKVTHLIYGYQPPYAESTATQILDLSLTYLEANENWESRHKEQRKEIVELRHQLRERESGMAAILKKHIADYERRHERINSGRTIGLPFFGEIRALKDVLTEVEGEE